MTIHGFVFEEFTKPVHERHLQVLLNVASLHFSTKDNFPDGATVL
jgi:hypothetical protein